MRIAGGARKRRSRLERNVSTGSEPDTLRWPAAQITQNTTECKVMFHLYSLNLALCTHHNARPLIVVINESKYLLFYVGFFNLWMWTTVGPAF